MPISKTATQIIATAYRHIGASLTTSGVGTDQKADGFSLLNDVLDSALLDVGLIFCIRDDRYLLTAGVQDYLIGPTAPAPFNVARPTGLQEANIILTSTTPYVRQKMNIITVGQWSDIPVLDIPRAIPLTIYYVLSFDSNGNSKFHLFPGPLQGYLLELFTWQQLQQFADLTTTYLFPPGYSEWMSWTLAEKMLPMMSLYIKTKEGRDVAERIIHTQALATRNQLISYNSRPPIINGNPMYAIGGQKRSGWNYHDGLFDGKPLY